jgi:hypothetical protein
MIKEQFFPFSFRRNGCNLPSRGQIKLSVFGRKKSESIRRLIRTSFNCQCGQRIRFRLGV